MPKSIHDGLCAPGERLLVDAQKGELNFLHQFVSCPPNAYLSRQRRPATPASTTGEKLGSRHSCSILVMVDIDGSLEPDQH